MRFTIVHAADLHLDSPLVGLERYEGAPVEQVRGASRRALENLVQLCLDEDAKLLLIAGDLYDGDWRDYTTGLFFQRDGGSRNRHAGGVESRNHDAEGKVTRHLRCRPTASSWARAAPVRTASGDQRRGARPRFATRAVTEDLSASYPRRSRARSTRLPHTPLSGGAGTRRTLRATSGPVGPRYDYWRSATCTSRVLQTRPGWCSPQLAGPHVRECGAKGATVLRVQDDAIVSFEARVLDVARFAR